MKKTAIALLSVASFFCLHAHAEVQCAPGYVAEDYDDDGNPTICRLIEEEPPASRDPNACDGSDINAIRTTVLSCNSAYAGALDECSEAALNRSMKSIEQMARAIETQTDGELKTGHPKFKKACENLKSMQTKTAAKIDSIRKNCARIRQECQSSCDLSSQHLGQYARMAPACHSQIENALGTVHDTHNACLDIATTEEKLKKTSDDLNTAAERASRCAKSADAGGKGIDLAFTDQPPADGGKDGDGKKAGPAAAGDGTGAGAGGTAADPKADPKTDVAGGPADTGGTPPTNGDTTGDEEKPKKKSNSPNQSEIGSLMGAATSLLSAFMQKSDPQSVEPIQLDASDCRRPENMNSVICRCQVTWTPDCNGTTPSSESFASQALPGVGGAQLNKEQSGSRLSLGPDQPMIEIPRGQNGGGGGGGGGMYAGGGGFSPPPANFIPDNNKGRGGSSLSSNILSGTYGGGMMGPGGRGVAVRPTLRHSRGGNSDPEDLPGYALGKDKDSPDFNSFLPPGAGAVGSQLPSRGISGLAGANLKEGMHPSSTDIFQAVSNRYRQLEFTLFADK
ncbi:MAG: hypothetical protein KF789_14620 [Bdellovibrionaceae bacterium]|nr:hypothetical protein [Pseudobdellovibrionaceae bacterium]